MLNLMKFWLRYSRLNTIYNIKKFVFFSTFNNQPKDCLADPEKDGVSKLDFQEKSYGQSYGGGTHILRFFMLRLPVHRNTIVQVTKIKNTFLSEFLFIRILNFPSTFLLELLFYPNFIVQKISLLERFLVILKNKQMFTITRFVFSQMTLLFTISIFTE